MEEKYIDLEGLTRYDLLLKSKIGLEVDAGHEYVEIGGIKWATMNVGANSVTDTGLYFQWGDTQGYTAEQVGSGEGKKYFDENWSDYKWTEDGGNTFTKYNGSDYTVLQTSDDAVTAAWGSNWRMPTVAEFQALGNAVTMVWTQVNNVYGILCTDNTDSSKTLFFPANGFCAEGSVISADNYGFYWSSSLYSRDSSYLLRFYDGYVNWQSSAVRRLGFPVRGIYTGDKPSGTNFKVLGTTILDSERTKWNNAVEDINNKADISSVYTKSEIDNIIGTINTELSNI